MNALNRLPRTRGDRPRSPSRDGRGRRAAPHTRGSTRSPRLGHRAHVGCPAHAGIDPRYASRSISDQWLPRTRGDRPAHETTSRSARGAPPHTRGSTLALWIVLAIGLGCPAHAGIDPHHRSIRGRRRWLPRTRGDRPRARCRCRAGCSAAPHTRGSTRRPAQRLPRTRGDRPSSRFRLAGIGAAAPHTRGSTLALIEARECLGGCPAHAGIDPHARQRPRAPMGLPRTRGDRPTPARTERRRTAAAPHTRGSTSADPAQRQRAVGCPAHAGIDPLQRAARFDHRRLPRTRGDRPTGCRSPRPACAAAPHTRGSTQSCAARDGAAPGCPAHAGIDPARADRRPRG